MKVTYEKDCVYDAVSDGVKIYLLPKCPNCEKYPTYNLNPCPYCGVELEYPEGVEVDND